MSLRLSAMSRMLRIFSARASSVGVGVLDFSSWMMSIFRSWVDGALSVKAGSSAAVKQWKIVVRRFMMQFWCFLLCCRDS